MCLKPARANRMVLWVALAATALLAMGAMVFGGCQPKGEPVPDNQLEAARQRGYLVIGCKYDSPPFGYLDTDGHVKGFEIDLGRLLADKVLGDPNAVKFVQVNTSTRIAALDAKHVDLVLATMTITEERKEKVTFSPTYYTAAQAVMVKADSAYRRVADLDGKPVAFVLGATSEARLKKNIPQAKLLGFKATTEAFSAFNAGRAQAFSTDDSILYGFVSEYCGVKLLEDRLSEEPYGMAFRKDDSAKPLVAAVSSALEQLLAAGEVAQLKAKWMRTNPPDTCAKP
ncbi:MAG: transporter substrate-binding domain-containing protein [Cyanobacteria bacterium HKST-UBA06]|nr:transporter substrate-binding domain-containing protein [Cyanobacteria bacterium HKST-UBA06]